MKKAKAPSVPANVEEFNTIAGLIFADLYPSFPVPKDIDLKALAPAMGVLHTDALPSGRTFDVVSQSTLQWLISQDFVVRYGTAMHQRAVLAQKGASGLARPLAIGRADAGSEIVDAAKKGGKAKEIASIAGEFIGSAIGAYTKSSGGV